MDLTAAGEGRELLAPTSTNVYAVYLFEEAQLNERVSLARDAAHRHGAEVVLTGVLPSLGKSDLTLRFMIEPGDSLAVLEAETVGGVSLRGEDSVRIVPD